MYYFILSGDSLQTPIKLNQETEPRVCRYQRPSQLLLQELLQLDQRTFLINQKPPGEGGLNVN
jgi:hypothetical protein